MEERLLLTAAGRPAQVPGRGKKPLSAAAAAAVVLAVTVLAAPLALPSSLLVFLLVLLALGEVSPTFHFAVGLAAGRLEALRAPVVSHHALACTERRELADRECRGLESGSAMRPAVHALCLWDMQAAAIFSPQSTGGVVSPERGNSADRWAPSSPLPRAPSSSGTSGKDVGAKLTRAARLSS